MPFPPGVIKSERTLRTFETHRQKTTKAPSRNSAWGFLYKNGGDLLSHTVARAVPSALKSLTSVFGMGTGGSSLL